MSALSRIAQRNHNFVHIEEGDTVLLASSLIPGNENAVYRVINGLARWGASVVHKGNALVHVSGHASAGELLYCYNIVKPRNVLPVHGEIRHLLANAELARATGVENVVIAEDGVVVDLVDGVAQIAGKVDCGYVFVDGSSVGDITESDLKDRRILGEEGFISVIVVVDSVSGKVAAGPEIHARGFALGRRDLRRDQAADHRRPRPGDRRGQHRRPPAPADRAPRHRPLGEQHPPPPPDDHPGGHRGLRSSPWPGPCGGGSGTATAWLVVPACNQAHGGRSPRRDWRSACLAIGVRFGRRRRMAGCRTAPSSSAQPSSQASSSAVERAHRGPQPPRRHPGATRIRAEGTGPEGVEPGCLLLAAAGTGSTCCSASTARWSEGDQVEVVGSASTRGTMTTCQQGLPLRVEQPHRTLTRRGRTARARPRRPSLRRRHLLDLDRAGAEHGALGADAPSSHRRARDPPPEPSLAVTRAADRAVVAPLARRLGPPSTVSCRARRRRTRRGSRTPSCRPGPSSRRPRPCRCRPPGSGCSPTPRSRRRRRLRDLRRRRGRRTGRGRRRGRRCCRWPRRGASRPRAPRPRTRADVAVGDRRTVGEGAAQRAALTVTVTGPKSLVTVHVDRRGRARPRPRSMTSVSGSTVTPWTAAVRRYGLLQERRSCAGSRPRSPTRPAAGRRRPARSACTSFAVAEVRVADQRGGAVDRDAVRVDRDEPGLAARRDAAQVDLERRGALGHGDEDALGQVALDAMLVVVPSTPAPRAPSDATTVAHASCGRPPRCAGRRSAGSPSAARPCGLRRRP